MRSLKLYRKLLIPEYLPLPTKLTKLENPIKPHRARTLGYKNIPAYTVYIGSINKGGTEPQIPRKGRSPVNLVRKYSRDISLKDILVNKILKKHRNMTFVGAYILKVDKYKKYYQIILKNTALLTNKVN